MEPMGLHIVSPERTLVEAAVTSVTLPGVVSPFMVLPGHAPLITALTAGEIRYVSAGEEHRVTICGGFVEVRDNQIDACVEV